MAFSLLLYCVPEKQPFGNWESLDLVRLIGFSTGPHAVGVCAFYSAKFCLQV